MCTIVFVCFKYVSQHFVFGKLGPQCGDIEEVGLLKRQSLFGSNWVGHQKCFPGKNLMQFSRDPGWFYEKIITHNESPQSSNFLPLYVIFLSLVLFYHDVICHDAASGPSLEPTPCCLDFQPPKL